MHFKITEKADSSISKFTAVCDIENAIFGGYGNTWAEAIGACVIANREVLDVTFDLYELDGTIFKSTVYNKSRE